jgi:hypothetical protein
VRIHEVRSEALERAFQRGQRERVAQEAGQRRAGQALRRKVGGRRLERPDPQVVPA